MSNTSADPSAELDYLDALNQELDVASQESDERRVHQRYWANAPLEITLRRKKTPLPARALNVSVSGIAFVCCERISPKTRITIAVHGAGIPPTTISARIVYNGEYHGAWAHGVSFRSTPTMELLTRISALTTKRGDNIPETKFSCPSCGSRRKRRCEGELFLKQVRECCNCGIQYRVVDSPRRVCLDELDGPPNERSSTPEKKLQHSPPIQVDPLTSD